MDRLLRAPEIQIRARLMAADACFYPQLKPSPSQQVDFDIIAAYLPYVDVLTTDAHMVELLHLAGVTDDYDTLVLSSRREGRAQLLDRVKGL